MNKKERIGKAKDCFQADKQGKYDELHVTSDGQCFGSDHVAFEHQKTVDKTEKVIKVKRDDISEERLSAAEVIDLIAHADSAEELEALVKGDDRKTVKEAAENRLELLNKDQD